MKMTKIVKRNLINVIASHLNVSLTDRGIKLALRIFHPWDALHEA